MPHTVVITGASSGIGHALALEYARRGERLLLFGRDQARLEATASACRAIAAEVITTAIDVRDRGAMEKALAEADSRMPVDLLIANAGILRGSADGIELEAADEAFAVFETNVMGLANTLHPLLGRMIARGRGQIAIMSSIAGLAPVPYMPAYSASKSAALNYGLALRTALSARGISVSVICPGFVDTPMTAQVRGAKPFLWPAEDAARRICRGLDKNEAVIAFPWLLAVAARVNGMLPEWVRRWTSFLVRFEITSKNV